MKRSILSIIIGLIFSVLFLYVLENINREISLEVALFLSSIITGFVARKKGLLHGLILGISGLFLFATFLLLGLGYDFTKHIPEIFYFIWIVILEFGIGVIIAGAGGFIGEYLYKRKYLKRK